MQLLIFLPIKSRNMPQKQTFNDTASWVLVKLQQMFISLVLNLPLVRHWFCGTQVVPFQ